MSRPNDVVPAHPNRPSAAAGFFAQPFDNGCAVFAAPERGMSHNDRTPQGVGVWPASIPRERQLTQQNGGAGVGSETVVVSPEGCRADGD